MTTQNVNVELPEEIYRRLQGMATMTHRSLEEVIYQTIRGNLPPTLDDLPPTQRNLVADLQQLDDEALWIIAKEPLPAQRWSRHQRLLHKAETAMLTRPEQEELERLRSATDHFVVRRSYALALLKWRGHSIPAML